MYINPNIHRSKKIPKHFNKVTTLDHVCQFFIKKRQNSLVYLRLTLESEFKGQKASQIQIMPDVCNKFFNEKKKEQFFSCGIWIFAPDNGLPEYLGGQILLESFENYRFKITLFSLFSWPLFCKEALPDRNFTFWEWFHRILLLTQQHLSKLWQKGFVMGFISKVVFSYLF